MKAMGRPSFSWSINALLFSTLLFEIGVLVLLTVCFGAAFVIFDPQIGTAFALGFILAVIIPWVVSWLFKVGGRL